MSTELFYDITAALSAMRAADERVRGLYRLGGEWRHRHWLNTPGPLYGAETDNCAMGPIEAPDHVAFVPEGYGGEVVFRQPVNRAELEAVLSAAWVDPWAGFGDDGDAHWTLPSVREWWAGRREVERAVAEHVAAGESPRAWLGYLAGGMHAYLRRYAFFLDTGRFPGSGDTLPDL